MEKEIPAHQKILSYILHSAASYPEASITIKATFSETSIIKAALGKDAALNKTIVKNMTDNNCWENLVTTAKTKKDDQQEGYYDEALQVAVSKDEWSTAESLLDANAGALFSEQDWKKLLDTAAKKGKSDFTLKIVKQSNTVAIKNYALMLAIPHKNLLSLITTLIKDGADATSKNSKDETVIDIAADGIPEDDGKRLLAILEARPDLVTGGHFNYALAVATRFGRDEVMKTLLKAGVSADVTKSGESLLHIVTRQESVERIHLLLEHGADISRKTEEGQQTAMDVALGLEKDNHFFNKEWKCVLALASKDCAGEDSYTTALVEAVIKGKTNVVSVLLEKAKVNPNKINSNNQHPLLEAASQGRLEILELLLAKDADTTTKDADTTTKDADTTTKDVQEEKTTHTALTLAVRHKHWNCVIALVTKEKNRNNKHCQSALMAAVNADELTTAKTLLILGINPNFKIDEQTPLHCAAAKNSAKMITILLEHGADKTATNKDGKKPSQLTTNQDCLSAFNPTASAIAEQHASLWSSQPSNQNNTTPTLSPYDEL